MEDDIKKMEMEGNLKFSVNERRSLFFWYMQDNFKYIRNWKWEN